jgi:glyoxylase-like metal-dependent hydrolase (beta-lactamase superfamily II)
MRIHHLNCGSLCPCGGSLFDGRSRGLFAHIVTHCLLIEAGDGLVLVDTGYGLHDMRNRGSRLSHIWRALLIVQFREDDAAVRQIERLGYSARDVRHIVLTHLDFDHAGGLEDFPDARIHLLRAELASANVGQRFVERRRYRAAQWRQVRNWRTYAPQGEVWFGFESVRELEGLPPEILMVPLAGHTVGHAGVAVQTAGGWLLHAGDAYLHRRQMETEPVCPPGLGLYQRLMDSDSPKRARNQARLRELKRRHDGCIAIFCSHDASELEALRTR